MSTRFGAMRSVGRRLAGTGLLLAASVLVLVAALGAALFTAVVSGLSIVFTAPWRRRRPRLGRWRGRGLRVLAVAAVYAGIEISGLIVAAGRWLRFQIDHDVARDRRSRVRSLSGSLDRLRRATGRFAGLDVVLVSASVPASGTAGESESSDAPGRTDPPIRRWRPERLELPAGPLIVCGRHGGVGGAFLLAHLLLSTYHRLPRVVLKQTLAWDPLIDALLSRIPHASIDPQPGDGGATAARIGALAQGMAADEALLIFPEGGNFTPRRRMRALRRLRRRGLAAAAERAARLRNV
ncbi:MAG: hypothetical protein HOV87_05440, partial [Catenulispora sp.]|nr:hypothetical protein [Catenulispora sp.]